MKLARAVVKHRVLILILTFALMIPAVCLETLEDLLGTGKERCKP